MTGRVSLAAVALLGWGLFLAAMGVPTLALIWRSFADPGGGEIGWGLSLRQWGLLGKSLGLVFPATILTILVALPMAAVLAREGGWRRGGVLGLLFLILLCPPMVYSFGWERVLPVGVPGTMRCVLVWVLWGWPVPALLLAAAWSRVGPSTWDAARLDASSPGALIHVVIPALIPALAASAVLLVMLFFTNYDVPHACGLLVFATELLSLASDSGSPAAAFRAAVPSVAAIILLMWAAWRLLARTFEAPEAGGADRSRDAVIGWGGRILFAIYLVVAAGVPLGVLAMKLSGPGVFVEVWRVYGRDLAWTLGLAAVAGGISAVMAVGLVVQRRGRRLVVIWALLIGMMPGALVGAGLIAAYNRAALWWLFDYWPIVALGFVSRCGWIVLLAALLARRAVNERLLQQARVDGADERQAMLHVALPVLMPVLLAGAALVAVMAVADATMVTMIRVPDFSPVSLIIIEKFHRFEYDTMIALSFFLVAAAGLAAWTVRGVWRMYSGVAGPGEINAGAGG